MVVCAGTGTWDSINRVGIDPVITGEGIGAAGIDRGGRDGAGDEALRYAGA